MKRKGITVVLCGVLAATMMTACGGNDVSSNAGQDDTVVSVPEKEEDVQDSKEVQEPVEEGIVAVPEKFTYTEENGELTITGYDGEVNILQVPESIDGKPVTKIGEDSFRENLNDGITKIIIPDSVTTIGAGAFIAASDLKEVEFGNGLKEIEACAFWRSTLESVTFPDSVERIGGDAFCYTKLKEVTIPPLVTVIENGAFAVSDIETITIPGHIKTIEDMAFQSCDSLKTVVIEEGVETIGDQAFGDCQILESITFPASVTEINEYVVSQSGQEIDAAVNVYVTEGSTAAKVLGEKYEGSERFKVITQ